jgi:hypothetical protein
MFSGMFSDSATRLGRRGDRLETGRHGELRGSVANCADFRPRPACKRLKTQGLHRNIFGGLRSLQHIRSAASQTRSSRAVSSIQVSSRNNWLWRGSFPCVSAPGSRACVYGDSLRTALASAGGTDRRHRIVFGYDSQELILSARRRRVNRGCSAEWNGRRFLLTGAAGSRHM